MYVSGNLFIYYEQGNPRAVVAPDVFVVFGVSKGDAPRGLPVRARRSYKTWEEGNKSPDFVLEITSKSAKTEDQETKPNIYAALGVREYFQYDLTKDYLNPQLQGLCLGEENYQPIATTTLPNDVLSLSSKVLGLELRLQSGQLRFYDPATGEILLTHEKQMQRARTGKLSWGIALLSCQTSRIRH